jgi:branched-subunit amino acid transport protein
MTFDIARLPPEVWIWVAVLGVALTTFLTRCSFILLGERVRLPAILEQALRCAPAGILAAIVVPDLLMQRGQLDLTFDNYRLMAAIIASGYFVVTRSMLGTITVGMAAFLLLRWALG